MCRTSCDYLQSRYRGSAAVTSFEDESRDAKNKIDMDEQVKEWRWRLAHEERHSRRFFVSRRNEEFNVSNNSWDINSVSTCRECDLLCALDIGINKLARWVKILRELRINRLPVEYWDRSEATPEFFPIDFSKTQISVTKFFFCLKGFGTGSDFWLFKQQCLCFPIKSRRKWIVYRLSRRKNARDKTVKITMLSSICRWISWPGFAVLTLRTMYL